MLKMLRWCFLLGLLFLLLGCDKGQIFHRLRPNSVVLAFGDSLTYGTGAEPGMGYPEQLQKLIARKITNAGIPGETSAEGARRLPGLLDEYQPDLVILCHGGNDMLQKLGKDQLKKNLRRMFEAVNQRGIPMIMISVPQPGLLLSDADVYGEMSEELNIPLVEDVLGKLLKDPRYKSDYVHLNADGYHVLAEKVADLMMDLRII